ncbi:hypothetical protein QJS04_geneDACA012848 [Acorus gramineus]|uniref:Uncharacterized protein n=1 Tax=Acorus gramineus TaxID=55184 RepID=A0AAV9BG22_ACOGR|nr:hypothetical protein QJS04_geneDACA012848 [Acorus gramineus]
MRVEIQSLSDMVFGFFEGTEWASPSSPESCCDVSIGNDVEAEEGEEEAEAVQDKGAFWNSQQQLLQAALSRSSSMEARVRRDVAEAKGTTARVVIELRFREEFEMARAGEDYNRLVGVLPEVFVGKAERLRGVIKIMCAAGKRCMKEKRMHMGPWRKHKYMLAKWLGACERVLPKIAFHVERLRGPTRARPQRTSMLTFDLLEKLSDLHCTSMEVV